jgi:prephenate dehydratase
MACRQAFPEMAALPCHSFEDAFAAAREGRAKLAMIPIDNTVAGRVADVHHLLPRGGLHIVGERFLRVNHHLLGVRGATLESVRTVESHVHALGQCRDFVRAQGYRVRVGGRHGRGGGRDRAGRRPDPGRDRVPLAAEIHGLRILKSDIEDAADNTTRFLVLAREPRHPAPGDGPVLTTFTFRVRNRPAALYKALGGFATERGEHGEARELPRQRLHPGRLLRGHHGAPGAGRGEAGDGGAQVLLAQRGGVGGVPGGPVQGSGGGGVERMRDTRPEWR